jgi:HSP20 family protein
MKYNHFNTNFNNQLWTDVITGAMNDFIGGAMLRKSPQANIDDDGQNIIISIVAPSLEKSDIKVSIEDGKLKISADKKTEVTEKEPKRLKYEWNFNQWTRVFNINNALDVNSISATYDLGLLKVTLPKKEKEKAQDIEVEIQ